MDSIPGSGRSPGGGHGHPLPFLPGESHGQRSLLGYNPQGFKGSDRTRQHAQCRLWLILIEFWLLGRGARFEDLFVSIIVSCCVTDSLQPVVVKIMAENTEDLYFSL